MSMWYVWKRICTIWSLIWICLISAYLKNWPRLRSTQSMELLFSLWSQKIRVLERNAPRSAAPERHSKTRSAAGPPLIKLFRSATRSGAPQMVGALPRAALRKWRSDRYKVLNNTFKNVCASREFKITKIFFISFDWLTSHYLRRC